MKKHFLSVLLALVAVLATQAAAFTKLNNADFGTLQTGDQVVLTYAFGGTIYAISAEEATGSAPTTIVITETDGKIEPDKTVIFTVGKVGDNFTFNSGNNMLNINASATSSNAHDAVRVSVPNKSATCVWNLSADYYLYAEVSSVNQYIGVNQNEGKTYLKVYNHSSQTSTNIKDETFALYYNRPHKITLNTVDGGTIASDMAFANKDEVVEITLTPAKGYEYVEGSLVYSYNDGESDKTEPITDNQFLMPAFDVTVTAEFEGHEPLALFDFTPAANPWGFPTGGSRLTETKSFTNSSTSQTITLTGTGNTENNGGYTWSSWGGGYLLFGKANATLALPAFEYSVSKIIVTGRSLASAKTEMNILVSGNPASAPTVGSQEENIYLISRDYRAAGNVYVLTVLNDNPAQVTTIDVYGTVPGMPEAPDVSVPAGVYKTEQLVELSSVTEGAKIYYTLDGSRPTESSALYSTAIPVADKLTIRAIAVKDGNKSEVTTAKYAIANVTAEGSTTSPYEVPDVQALNNPGWKAWVHGYIIDGFEPNIKIRALSSEATNAIAIAASATETDPSKMVFVELPQGKVRNALNIVSNPTLKGHEVWVYGVLSNYGGQPGVSKTSKYYLDEVPVPTAVKEIQAVNDRPFVEKRLVNGHLYIYYNGKCFDVLGRQQ